MDTIKKNIILFPLNILFKISPEVELKLLFRIKQGYKLNLKNPKTYNEKLQWIKIYDKNPLMAKCVDKYKVRDYVKEKECADILNELIWEGFNPKEIPFEKLPNKFVIKVTHGSTFNIICKDKNKLNIEQTIKKLNKWLKAKFIPCYGEWFYGVEKPRIIIEKYIESEDDNQLKDYKVFCFNGKPQYIRIDSDRFSNLKSDLYDEKWNYIKEEHMGHKAAGDVFKKPKCLLELLKYASKLSKPFMHARVDFYIVEEKIYFGEITFTNGAGFDKFTSNSFDLKMGNLLDLDEVRRKDSQ